MHRGMFYRISTMNDAIKNADAPECSDIVAPEDDRQQWHDRDEELAALAKALAHPARARIVRFLLAQGEDTCICGDICEEIPLAQSTVSQHLKVLRAAGIIHGRVDGPRICYCVDRERLRRLEALLVMLQEHSLERST